MKQQQFETKFIFLQRVHFLLLLEHSCFISLLLSWLSLQQKIVVAKLIFWLIRNGTEWLMRPGSIPANMFVYSFSFSMCVQRVSKARTLFCSRKVSSSIGHDECWRQYYMREKKCGHTASEAENFQKPREEEASMGLWKANGLPSGWMCDFMRMIVVRNYLLSSAPLLSHDTTICIPECCCWGAYLRLRKWYFSRIAQIYTLHTAHTPECRFVFLSLFLCHLFPKNGLWK